jgi:hypothetical protein
MVVLGIAYSFLLHTNIAIITTLVYNHIQRSNDMENTIKCELCGLVCSMQISGSHLRAKHNMTTKEYKALGYTTMSEARREQVMNTPVAKGLISGIRGKYGKDHWNWQGGHTNGQGYKIIYHSGRRGVEHRVVAEKMIGRPLERDEIVHHIDGNRANNTESNLQIMKKGEHDRLAPMRKIFRITEDSIESAHVLRSCGWSIAKISRALRVEPEVVKNWITGSTYRKPNP